MPYLRYGLDAYAASPVSKQCSGRYARPCEAEGLQAEHCTRSDAQFVNLEGLPSVSLLGPAYAS